MTSNVFQLEPHEKMTPEECLEYCRRNSDEFERVIITGWDKNGDFILRGSDMKRGDAVLILMAAVDYARDVR